MSIFTTIRLIVGVSQLYWAWRGYSFAVTHIPSRGRRAALCGAVLAVYLLLYEFTFGVWSDRGTPVHLTVHDALLDAPFRWWIASSLFAFLVAILFAIPKAIVAGVQWALARRHAAGPDIQSPPRRRFLERTAAVATGAPFVAGAYGLLYGRLNLETTAPSILLRRLPRAFEGFRICQLSDIHIGPFMPAEEIRKYVAIANAQQAEMVVLTGDFVTLWLQNPPSGTWPSPAPKPSPSPPALRCARQSPR